ncbi:MAG: I78 family peptidase inhibitor [Pseudomonadota bacterium]|nr:I78 family peptidase inhibitor [Pseudomonadota bacterium]
MAMRPMSVLLLALPLAACAPMPPPAPPSLEMQCVAEAGSWAIGKGVDDDIVERVRVDTRSKSVRVIRPGQAVTMDYRVDRVNIKLNERDAIVGISCG